MSDSPELLLTVPAEAADVAIVRQALAGLGEAVGLEEAAVADLKTIVTEACMNAVIHAYPEETGPIEISAWREGEDLCVIVCDYGIGFQARPAEGEAAALRLGLPLIAALADGFQIRGGPGQGTEVRMRKRIVAADETPREPPEASDFTRLRFAEGAPAQPILSRVIGTLAARADLSIDRLSDTMMIADAVSATAPSNSEEPPLWISIADSPERLELCIDPLPHGGAERLLDAMDMPGPPLGSLRALASEIRAEPLQDDAERLVIVIEGGGGQGQAEEER